MYMYMHMYMHMYTHKGNHKYTSGSSMSADPRAAGGVHALHGGI